MEAKTKINTPQYVWIHPDGKEQAAPADPIQIDFVLRWLYDEIKNLESQEITTVQCKLLIMEFLENPVGEQLPIDQSKNKLILDFLQSLKVIENYKQWTITKEIIFKKWAGNIPTRKADLPLHMAQCQLIPAKFAPYTIARFAANKAHLEKIAELYLELIRMIEQHFNGSIILDLTLNHYYELAVKQLRQLLDSNLQYGLFCEVNIPFSNLIMDQEHLLEIKQNIRRITGPMHDRYGQIQDILNFFTLKQPEQLDLQQLRTYINKFSNIKPPLLPDYQVQQQVEYKAADGLKPELTVSDLSTFNDGSIRYKGGVLDLRNQLKDLCRLLMQNHKKLVTIDAIRDEIIRADKRSQTSFTTISKYVSELHNSLKDCFKRDVIFNQKEEGWYMKI